MNDQSESAGTIEALRRTINVQASLLQACRDHLALECEECNLKHLESCLYDCSHLHDLECEKICLIREADAFFGDDDNQLQHLRVTHVYTVATNLCSELERLLSRESLAPQTRARLDSVVRASRRLLSEDNPGLT